MFNVAEPDKQRAMEMLNKLAPNIHPISGHVLSAEIINFLKMPLGRVDEWVSADPRQKLTPRGSPV